MAAIPATSTMSMAGSLGMSASQGLASDARSLDNLKGMAARDPKAAVKETARQFESLFMQELLKSMRQATMKADMLDNAGTQMGTEMLDTQMATKMTGLPGGLGEAIARQLERQLGGVASKVGQEVDKATTNAMRDSSAIVGAGGTQAQASFLARNAAGAKAAERTTGIPAEFMLGQAAHESGWGRREILNADGSSSNNLFGIKAGPSWSGPTASVTTTEYVDGVPRKVVAKFRSYASPEESFADFARLMKDNPRYADVMQNSRNAASFAQGLQKAGYATDPSYADKLTRVINTTVRLTRAST